LASQLGVACAKEVLGKNYGNMIAVKGESVAPVSLSEVAGKKKYVPLDHEWISCARKIGTCLGDEV